MSREKIIEVAHSQLGVSENPPGTNKNPYGAWYGFDGYAWCAMFVSWVYDQAGSPLGKIDDAKGYRDCNSAYRYWKAHNELTKAPEAGDIVLFDWEGDGKCNHTGIFHEWTDSTKKTFWCYEGNTAVGDDSNGGMVMRRKRNTGPVKAFVKPKVLAGTSSIPATDTDELKKGDSGADVTALQKQLHTLGYKITVDGDFGPETEKVLLQFQKENQLTEDGIATSVVLGFIESKLQKPPVTENALHTGAYLRQGNAGYPVTLLQKALNRAGASPALTEDGVFGADTLAAVIKFQQEKGLVADGIAGPRTLGLLGATE